MGTTKSLDSLKSWSSLDSRIKTLIIQAFRGDGHRTRFEGSYLFKRTDKGWLYYGLILPKSTKLYTNGAPLKVSNNLYALTAEGIVPTELGAFLDEQSRGRPRAEIELKLTRKNSHEEMEVHDLSEDY